MGIIVERLTAIVSGGEAAREAAERHSGPPKERRPAASGRLQGSLSQAAKPCTATGERRQLEVG
jgi:hypothetical protein